MTLMGAPAIPTVGSHSERSGSFRPDIQGLRALAVILVVLDHARIGPFHGGYIGVDVFFVISGFLITGLLLAEADRRGRISLLDFYARRAKRILPAATLVLVATAVAGYFLLSGIQAIRLFKDTIWATFFAANIKFAGDETDYFAQDDAVPPIQHYWSLAVEEQFYVVWPLIVLLLVALFRSRGRARRAVVLAIAVISLASFAWAMYAVGDNPRGAYFSTPARAWELGLGAATAAAVLRLRTLPPPVLAAASWAGVAMIGIAALSFTGDTRFPGAPALLPVVGTALLLGGGTAAAGWGPQRFFSVLPMRWIGDRSYSFYLWHWPALILVAEVWRVPEGWTGLLISLAALGLADLSYRYVENPFRDRLFFKPRWRGIALYPASVAVLGLVVFSAHSVLIKDLNEKRPAITADEYCDRADAPKCSDNPDVRLVQASVLAAQDDAEIPNPLRPAALGLADHVAADLGGCEYWGIPDPMPLCERGDPDGDRTMVLLGDSHMRHWVPALERIAARNGYRSFSFVLQGCTPALVLPYSPYYEAPDSDCTFFHEWTQDQIEALHPDLVVMSTDTQARYVTDDGAYVDDSQDIARMIEAGMVERIESLKPLTERIVVLGDVPRLAFDPAVISERGATLADGLSDPTGRSMLMRRAVKAAAETTGIDYIETKQWFCAFDKCAVVVGDYITHRDRGHMTLEYSSALSGALGRRLHLDEDIVDAVSTP